MSWFWMTFDDNSKGTIEAGSLEEAVLIAEKKVGKQVIASHTIYRPAGPIIAQKGNWPAFCWKPEQCKERCEAHYSCVD